MVGVAGLNLKFVVQAIIKCGGVAHHHAGGRVEDVVNHPQAQNRRFFDMLTVDSEADVVVACSLDNERVCESAIANIYIWRRDCGALSRQPRCVVWHLDWRWPLVVVQVNRLHLESSVHSSRCLSVQVVVLVDKLSDELVQETRCLITLGEGV